MDKSDVIQTVIDVRKAKTYLEIGVADGSTFLKIRARRKYGVDPEFHIRKKIKRFLLNPRNCFNNYFQMSSDVFFETQNRVLVKHGLDVVLVDGLHTYSQSFKDVENALRFLNPGGIIVMHDCNPPYEAAACPANSAEHAASLNVPGWTGAWNGDVWKTIVFLRSTRKDLRICVLDSEDGIGLISRGAAENVLEYSKEEVNSLTYKDLAADRTRMLNLKTIDYLRTYLEINAE